MRMILMIIALICMPLAALADDEKSERAAECHEKGVACTSRCVDNATKTNAGLGVFACMVCGSMEIDCKKTGHFPTWHEWYAAHPS
jgi:hypothetical protein